jgi:hypothetical protein
MRIGKRIAHKVEAATGNVKKAFRCSPSVHIETR